MKTQYILSKDEYEKYMSLKYNFDLEVKNAKEKIERKVWRENRYFNTFFGIVIGFTVLAFILVVVLK